MSFCQHCGTQLPDAAKFCSSCGKPLLESVAVCKQGLKDNCEITTVWLSEKWGILPSDYLQFRAVATGPSGAYTAGESAKIKAGLGDYYGPNPKNNEHMKALETLKDKLREAGWQEAGSGEAWYNLRFTRPSADEKTEE